MQEIMSRLFYFYSVCIFKLISLVFAKLLTGMETQCFFLHISYTTLVLLKPPWELL